MAKLKVFLNGQFESQHELEEHRELLVGRGETCDVVLNPERGISRQHFRVRFVDGHWIVEVLSRFGELYRNHEKQSIFNLGHGMTFSVPPYEFVFENESENLRSINKESTARFTSTATSDEDKTHIGYLPALAYLKLTDQIGRLIQNYKLEGQMWIGGRDTTCSIYIDNQKISRRQFEIQRQDDSYFIRDLESVNVTLLNGRPLGSEDWTALQSSDIISVADWTLSFELRDSAFEQRLQEVDPHLMLSSSDFSNPTFEDSSVRQERAQASQGYSQFSKDPRFQVSPQKPGMTLFGRHIPGMNPVRLGIICVVLLAAIYGVVSIQPEEKQMNARAQTPFEKLSPDKQQIVKQIYLTAQSLIAQSRYELARQEVIKLHQIIPYYEDSKEIEETANRGLAILAEREKNEAEERQKAELEQKVIRQVAECRAQLNDKSDSVWLESCLAPVMEFNPEHPGILALRNEIERLSNERIVKAANAKEYAEKVAALRALFNKAAQIEKEGLPIPAIEAYHKVAKSKLPDPNGLTKIAKRQIASLEASLESKQAESEKAAEQAYKAGQLKKAIQLLREGIKINPDNEVIKGKHAQYLLELRKMMMGFYQEGILEESVGDVESAKSKWKKILEQSLPGEDYFEKARMKLKKYGGL